ncbi:MAG: PrgI family protein [Lachnospiraceae bacterium]|nr:PrgI family protein [Lachnospiraceae bacterium]
MGTYNIPRNLRGESRILIIFSVKSLITTAIGAGVGLLFYLLFSICGLGMVGVITMAAFALIGYAVGAVKIPTLSGLPFTKKIGGESLDEIIRRYVKFRMNKKIYIYTKEENE